MGYKVNFDALDMMYYEIQGQMIKWNEGITNVSEKMADLITSDEIAGKGANSIKSYLQTVHLAIMQSLSEICKSHLENCMMYKNDYQINIDQSYHAMIQEDELMEIRKRLHENQERTGTVDYHIKTALTNVSDIFYTYYTGAETVDSTYEQMKHNITRLDEEIICLENRHMNDDFRETEALIEELKTFINDQLSREKNYISNYTPEVLANSAQYAKLYQANMELTERQAFRTDELQLAYDHEKKKIEFLEEEAAKKRAEEGWKTGLFALGSIVIGVVAIVGTAGAATPVVATAWVVGGSAIAYGVSDLVEAGQDIYYGTTGDPYTAAINPIRDTIFCGNQTAYMIWGEVSTTISGLIVPVGQSYTLAKATGQTGKLFAATVGKTVAKELAEDFVIGQVSMGAGSLVQNVTGNASLGTLAGVTAGITAGKGSGKALHSVDNAASGVKSIKQIDSAMSGVKGIDSMTKPNVGGVDKSSNSLINIDAIRPQLKTEPNTAFFWSGRTDGVGGAEVAADIAKGRGGVTLESMIEAKKISMPEWDFNNPSTMEAWDLASGAYAEQVSGEIRAVIGSELRPGNIWENVELPRLKNNPNVTKIITIDPKTGIEKIIFER